jgi:hypothetical protein
VERSDASGGSEIGERLATAAETSSAGPPPPPAESAADTRTRRGRRIVFGLLGLCALLVIALGALVFFTRGQPPVKASSAQQASPTSGDRASPPLGFADSLTDKGWQQWKPDGFSLGLPPLWIPYVKDIPDPGPYLEWVATGYFDTRFQANAWLKVFKVPVDPREVAETMFERGRLQVLADPTVVRASDLMEMQLSDGVGYTYTAVSETPSGRWSETSYEILHEGYVYALVISVPVKHRDEYGSLFGDIARTFEITD